MEAGGFAAGGPPEFVAGTALHIGTTNVLETTSSLASTGITVVDDWLLDDDPGIGVGSVQSVAGSMLGYFIPIGSVDSIIDGFLSAYNHGLAPSIPDALQSSPAYDLIRSVFFGE